MGRYLTVIFIILLWVAYTLGVMRGESSVKDVYVNEHFLVKKVLLDLKIDGLSLYASGNGELYISGSITQENKDKLEQALKNEFAQYTTNTLFKNLTVINDSKAP